MGRVYVNSYSDTVSTASVGTSDTSFDVSSAPAVLSSGEYYIATLTDDLTSPTKTEIIKITGISSNTLTVVRAQEGTSASTWATGDNIEIRATAASFETLDNPTLVTYTETTTTGTVDIDASIGTIQTLTIASNPTFTDSLADGQSVTYFLTAMASYTPTFPTMTWVSSSGDTEPTWTASDVVTFTKVGSTLYGFYAGSFA